MNRYFLLWPILFSLFEHSYVRAAPLDSFSPDLYADSCGWNAALTTLELFGLNEHYIPQEVFINDSKKLDAWSLTDIGEFLRSSSKLNVIGLTHVDKVTL